MKDKAIEERAIQALRECLAEVPFVQIKKVRKEPAGAKPGPDILADLMLSEQTRQQLVIEVKSSGQPRLARDAVSQLRGHLLQYPKAYGVFMAPYISAQSAEICSQAGLGYLDFAGNGLLSFLKVFIRKKGGRNPFSEKRDLRSLYSPKASRVLRVLLLRARESWKTQPLADEAGVSLGQVSNVKKLLRDREWIKEDDEGFSLSRPQTVLAEWSENYTYRKNIVREFYSMKDSSQLESDLAHVCRAREVQFALTGFSGALRIAPTVRSQRVMAYVSGIDEQIVTRLGLKEVPSGSNVSLLMPHDEGVYYGAREYDGLRVVSPVQLYLDLKGYKGRGEEAAEAIMRKAISKLW